MKKFFSFVLVLILASAALLAQGQKEKPQETVVVPPEERPYYVRDPKDVTGVVTCYTTMGETELNALYSVWYKYYPNCKIEIQPDSVGTLATRVRSDQSCKADVMLGGMFAADGDRYHDILQPYTPACDKELLYHDPSGYCTYYDVQLMCLVVNPVLRDQMGIKINGYKDLLQPELAGKIILAAPEASSSGWRQVQTILATMGDKFDDEKGWDYIAKLLPNTFSTNSSKDVYNLVINGEYVVGLSYESGVVAQIKDGAPVDCVYMEEGNTAMAGGAAIIKTAQNLPAAQAMIDIISSTEFQEARAEMAAGRPSNGKAKLTDLPSQSTMKMYDLDLDYLKEHKEDIINRWNDIIASKI